MLEQFYTVPRPRLVGSKGASRVGFEGRRSHDGLSSGCIEHTPELQDID